ncbi:unnamed protein product [Caretta caretta]
MEKNLLFYLQNTAPPSLTECNREYTSQLDMQRFRKTAFIRSENEFVSSLRKWRVYKLCRRKQRAGKAYELCNLSTYKPNVLKANTGRCILSLDDRVQVNQDSDNQVSTVFH